MLSHQERQVPSRGNKDRLKTANNPYGALGTRKCVSCREKKRRCHFEDPDASCDYCTTHNIQCGPKTLASTRYVHTGRIEGHPYSGAPSPRHSSRPVRSPFAEPQPPFPGQPSPTPSDQPKRLSALASQLEIENSHLNIFEILALANKHVEALRAQNPLFQQPAITKESSITHRNPGISENPLPAFRHPSLITAPPVTPLFNTEGNTGLASGEFFNSGMYDASRSFVDFAMTADLPSWQPSPQNLREPVGGLHAVSIHSQSGLATHSNVGTDTHSFEGTKRSANDLSNRPSTSETELLESSQCRQLILQDPHNLENWRTLVAVYRRYLSEPTIGVPSSIKGSFILTDSQVANWLNLEHYEERPVHHPSLANDSTWIEAVRTLIHSPDDELKRAFLTWEVVQQSRLNSYNSLHTARHDDVEFIALLQEASQKYPDSPEFPIALALAGITIGQYYNGLAGLEKVTANERFEIPTSYKRVLKETWESWLKMAKYGPASSLLNPHERSKRAVNFYWSSPITSTETDDLVDHLLNSVALMSIELSVEANSQNEFQPARSSTRTLMKRMKLDYVGRLVNDHWGPLGDKVLGTFFNLLKDADSEGQIPLDHFGIQGPTMRTTDSCISLIGYASIAEWECIVSCLKWLVSIMGDPQDGFKVRRCIIDTGRDKESTKVREIWGDHPHFTRGFEETYFEEAFVLQEQALLNPNDELSEPCWIQLLAEACIGVHVEHHCSYYNTGALSKDKWIGKGLKVPFEILVQIAGIDRLLNVDGTPILCGFQTTLVPITRLEDGSVQWHFVVAQENDGPFRWFHHREDFLRSLPNHRLRDTNIDDLKGTAYVGWYKSGVTVTLGTIEPPNEIPKSHLPQTPYTYVSSGAELQMAIQFTPVSGFGGSFAIAKGYRRYGLTTRFTPSENFCAMVDQLYSKHIILYNEGTKTALLCIFIHLVLALLRTYLRDNGYQFDVNLLKFPLGVERSRAIIRRLGSELIEEGFTFADAFRVVTHRYSSVNASLPQSARCTNSEILGFELADMVGNNDGFTARKLAVHNGVQSWSQLAQNTDVVFCGGFGDIVAVEQSPDAPHCLRLPPLQVNVLIFPIPLVKRYFDEDERGRYYRQRGRHNFQWVPTGSLFHCTKGSKCDGRKCWKDRLQRIQRGDGILRRRDSSNVINSMDLDWLNQDGALCFGRL